MNSTQRIQTWVNSRLDGRWEHKNGIQIANTDNPGWMADIICEKNELKGRALTEFKIGEVAGIVFDDRIRLYHTDIDVLLSATATYLEDNMRGK